MTKVNEKKGKRTMIKGIKWRRGRRGEARGRECGEEGVGEVRGKAKKLKGGGMWKKKERNTDDWSSVL